MSLTRGGTRMKDRMTQGQSFELQVDRCSRTVGVKDITAAEIEHTQETLGCNDAQAIAATLRSFISWEMGVYEEGLAEFEENMEWVYRDGVVIYIRFYSTYMAKKFWSYAPQLKKANKKNNTRHKMLYFVPPQLEEQFKGAKTFEGEYRRSKNEGLDDDHPDRIFTRLVFRDKMFKVEWKPNGDYARWQNIEIPENHVRQPQLWKVTVNPKMMGMFYQKPTPNTPPGRKDPNIDRHKPRQNEGWDDDDETEGATTSAAGSKFSRLDTMGDREDVVRVLKFSQASSDDDEDDGDSTLLENTVIRESSVMNAEVRQNDANRDNFVQNEIISSKDSLRKIQEKAKQLGNSASKPHPAAAKTVVKSVKKKRGLSGDSAIGKRKKISKKDFNEAFKGLDDVQKEIMLDAMKKKNF